MKKSKRIALLALLLALTVILSLIPIRVSSATLALTLLPVLVLALTQDFFTGLLGGLVMGVTSLVMAFSIGAASPTAPIFQNPLVSIVPRLFVPAVAFAVMKGLGALAKRIYFTRHPMPAAAKETSKDASFKEQAPSPATETADADLSATDAEITPYAETYDKADNAASENKSVKNAGDLPRLLQAFIDGAACLAGVLTNTGLVLGMMWALYGGKNVGDTLISPEFMTAMISINFVIEIVLFPLVTPPVVLAVRKNAFKHS